MNHLKMTIAAAAALAFASSGAGAQDRTYISIGSNPVGNTAYQWAAGIADLVNRNFDNVEMTAEGTRGYLENVLLMMDGEIEAGFSNTKIAYEAYEAIEEFEGQVPGQVLSWISVAPIIMHVVVPAASNIQSLSELEGARVGIGQPGGTSMIDAEILMEAAGLTPGGDFQEFRVGLGEMAEMLANGQIDALVWNGTPPLPPLLQLQATNDIRLIPIPEDVVTAIQDQYPSYLDGAIAAGTYDGQEKATSSTLLGNVLAVRADVPEEIVYEATKLVMENLDHMAGVHPAWSRVSPDTVLGGFRAPLHPGALRYYREADIPGLNAFLADVGQQ